jgi:XapX domain-containing protein
VKLYLVAFEVGTLVGCIYVVLNVRSQVPQIVALVGLLGVLLGEQIVPMVKKIIAKEPVTVAWSKQHCSELAFGQLPSVSTSSKKLAS